MIEIGSDRYLSLNNLTDNLTGSYINDATVLWSLQTPGGTEVGSGSVSYEADSDGKYEGVILAAVTSTLTDLTEYVIILTATKSGNTQKFVERVVAISTTGNWIRYDSHYFDELGTLTDSDKAVLSTKIKASQEAIEKYCNRVFAQTDIDEQLEAQQDGSVVLSNFPVIAFKRLFDKQQQVVTLTNSTAQVANASTTDSALLLYSVVNGVETATTLSYSDYATLSSLATAITAVSNWSASISSGWESYPTDDLVSYQHTSVDDNGYLSIWNQSSGNRFQIDESTGLLKWSDYGRASRVRVIYTSGFADVPEPLKEIAAKLAMNSYNSSQDVVSSESIGDYSYSVASASEQLSKLPLNNQIILNQYRDRWV